MTAYRIYTSAFRSSDCCGARFERVCQAGELDIYICTKCWNPCWPVEVNS